MNPQQIFCHNPACPARGKVGKGNIGVHSRKQHRYICHECETTFTQSKGTLFYRYSCITQVITLLAYGCPLQAIVAAFGIDERTVVIPFLKDYIALAVLRKYENEVSFAIADFGYFPRISLNCCCIWSNV